MNRRIAAIFPVVLWLVATMFLGGDLGRWNDDYEFNQRTPETGKFDRLTEPMEGQFWRPLFFTIVPALQTLCWDHAWLNHAIQAVAHGVGAIALWHLLGTLGVSRGVRGPLSLLFLTCPIVFQALFWSASLPTILSAAAFMQAVTCYVRWLRGSGGRGTLAWFLVLGVLIPLLNEQPAPAVVVLPLLAIGLPVATGRRHAWLRAVGPPALLAVLYGVYLAAYFATTPAGYPATRTTLVRFDHLGSRAGGFVAHGVQCLRMGGAWRWFWDAGFQSLGGVWGLLASGGLALSGIAWAARSPGSDPAGVRPSRSAVAVFGILGAVLSSLPVFLIVTYDPASRLFYAPMVGLVVALGAVIDELRARFPRLDLGGAAARGAVALVCMAGAVCLIGAQRAFQASDRADTSYAGQLRDLVPAPRPGAFFVPVRIDDPAARLAPTWLDLNFHTVLLSSFNVRMWIKHAMGRSDVHCGTYSPDHGAYPLADRAGLGYAWKFVDRAIAEDPPGVWRVPWEQVVPFEIDRLGTVRIVPRIVLERADNADAVFAVAGADSRWGRTCAYYDRAADGSVHPLGAWSWEGGGEVAFTRRRAWTAVHTATQLGGTGGRRAMRTALPRTPAVTTLYFRATLPEEQALPGTGEPERCAAVSWTVEGGPGAPERCVFSSRSVGADQRWTAVTITVPPHPDADWMLRASLEACDGTEPGEVLVTSGLWSARLP